MTRVLPTGWKEKTLGEVSKIGAGNSAPQDPSCFVNGSYNFFRTSDIGKVHFGRIERSEDLLNQKGCQGLHLFKAGTILIPKSGASTFLNHRVKMEKDGYVVSHLATVEANNNIVDEDYLLYFLSTIDSKTLIQSHSYPSLNLPIISSIKVIFPSLLEQKRIVEKLDKIFADIDKAKENTNKNLENTKEIFCSELQKVFENKNLNWVKYKLSKITTKIGSGATPLGGRNSYITTGISLIRSMNVYDNQFVYEELAHITKEQAKKLDNVTIQANDLLLNITGASVARCCVVPEDILPARVNQHVSILRPISELVNANFLCYLLISKPYKQKLLKDGEEGGSTRQALTKEGLKCFEVSIPKDIQSQEDIVNQLNALRAKTQELEQIYTKKLADLDELKQSVLQRAFSGKL